MRDNNCCGASPMASVLLGNPHQSNVYAMSRHWVRGGRKWWLRVLHVFRINATMLFHSLLPVGMGIGGMRVCVAVLPIHQRAPELSWALSGWAGMPGCLVPSPVPTFQPTQRPSVQAAPWQHQQGAGCCSWSSQTHLLSNGRDIRG